MEKIVNVKLVAKVIGVRTSKWLGNCYGIATAMIDAGLVPGGVAVYGHWTGPIARTSFFAARRDYGFCQHGWIVRDDADHTVIDPTRWVFEDRAPYVYVGTNTKARQEVACTDFLQSEDMLNYACMICGHLDEEHEDGFFRRCTLCIEWPYDEGGNKLRASLAQPCPKAKKDEGRRPVSALPAPTLHFLAQATGDSRAVEGLTSNQTFWVANLSLDVLGEHAVSIYVWLGKLGLSSLVPIDNMRKVSRELKQVRR